MMQRHKFILIILCFLFENLISCKEDATKFDTITFSDSKILEDSMLRLNILLYRLPISKQESLQNYYFNLDTLYINNSRMSTVSFNEAMSKFNNKEKNEIFTLTRFLKTYDIESAYLDLNANLWFFNYGNQDQYGFKYFRFLVSLNNLSDSFRISQSLNRIIDRKDKLILCAPIDMDKNN